MSIQPDVLVHGGGIVSRVIALLLAARRLRVGLGERPQAPAADIRAYAINAASRRLLESLRAWPADALATPVQRMEVIADGQGRVDFDATELGEPALAWIVDVPALEDLLEQAVRFQPLITLMDPKAMPGPLAQGPNAPLSVICEGRASTLRAQLGIDWQPLPYGQQAIAARLRLAQPHQGVARQWFRDGEITALLPMEGPQGNLAALVWSVRDEHARTLMQLDDTAFCAELGALCGEATGALSLHGPRQAWALRAAQAQQLSGPGWVLAGDAAHAVHPLAGQGLNLGLADAAALDRALGRRDGADYWRGVADRRLLRAYERERQADLAVRTRLNDGLFHVFAHGDARVRALRDAGMHLFTRAPALKRLAARAAMGSLEK